MGSFQIRKAGSIINEGGVIGYPTESVYGLGCHPFSEQALGRILRIKQRCWKKGMLIVASDLTQVIPYLSESGQELTDCFNQDLGHPVTWLLPASGAVSPLLRGQHTKIAIRLSTNPHIQAICQQANSALVSTSANFAGKIPMTKASQLRNMMGLDLDQIICGSVGGFARPSAIIDAQTKDILRSY